MGSKQSTRPHHLRALLPVLFAVYAPAVLVLFGLEAVTFLKGVPIESLTKDPTTVMNAPFYTGILSSFGILLWCSTAAICLFSYVLSKRTAGRKELASFLLFSGILTAVLLLDDYFLLHEGLFPKSLHIPEWVILGGYGLAVLLYLIRYRNTLRKTELPLLLFALGFFGLSIIIDVAFANTPGAIFPEDGSKFLGIVGWSTYLIRVCGTHLTAPDAK